MIVNKEKATDILRQLRKDEIKIGMCSGSFDLLHAGHIEHFMMAKSCCDFLFVVIAEDRYAAKGPDRPLYSQLSRAEIVDAIEAVDFVLCDVFNDETSCSAIELVKPDLYFKGTEYRDKVDLTRNIDREVSLVRKYSGDIRFVSGAILSSTKLIKNLTKTPEFCKHAKNTSYYMDLLDKINDLKVAVIGEGILDEYITSTSLGSANKYPILSMEVLDSRVDEGGAFAVYNLIKGLCDKSYLLSQRGECPFFDGNIIKTRYVDKDKHNKMFEVNQKFESSVRLDILSSFLNRSDIDVLLIADFGHGAFTDDVIQLLSGSNVPKYLMVQHNSSNRHMNFPWKYDNVQKRCVCMNKKEAIVNSGEVNIEMSTRYLYDRLNAELLLLLREVMVRFVSMAIHYGVFLLCHPVPETP